MRPTDRRTRVSSMFAALSLAALGGCEAVTTGASVVSLMATKKTVADHVISFATGEECSLVAYERGEPYCVDPDAPLPPTPVHYCYRTLGSIDCYVTEDPFRNGHTAVR